MEGQGKSARQLWQPAINITRLGNIALCAAWESHIELEKAQECPGTALVQCKTEQPLRFQNAF